MVQTIPLRLALLMPLMLHLSCNGLFYYPMQDELATPSALQINFSRQRITTPSGVELAAWWMKPHEAKRKHRVVLQFHGNAENMSTHFRFVAWLVDEGYDVVTFDYRGYGLSTPEPPTQIGLVEDGCAILRWLMGVESLDQAPVFIVGQSLGGAVAVSTLAACPMPRVRGVIIDSSFSSYRRTARLTLANLWLTWPLQYPLSLLVSDVKKPLDAIQAVRVPFLFFHSRKDPVVPYELGRELFEAAPSPKTFVEVLESGHTKAFVDPHGPYRTAILDFLER